MPDNEYDALERRDREESTDKQKWDEVVADLPPAVRGALFHPDNPQSVLDELARKHGLDPTKIFSHYTGPTGQSGYKQKGEPFVDTSNRQPFISPLMQEVIRQKGGQVVLAPTGGTITVSPIELDVEAYKKLAEQHAEILDHYHRSLRGKLGLLSREMVPLLAIFSQAMFSAGRDDPTPILMSYHQRDEEEEG